VIHDADGLGAEAVEHETRRLVDRIAGIDAEPSQPYRRLRDGDYPAQLRALHPDLAPGRTDLGIHRRSDRTADPAAGPAGAQWAGTETLTSTVASSAST